MTIANWYKGMDRATEHHARQCVGWAAGTLKANGCTLEACPEGWWVTIPAGNTLLAEGWKGLCDFAREVLAGDHK